LDSSFNNKIKIGGHKMITLFDYQQKALNLLIEAFRTKIVALVVMATGLGKTIVAAFWAKSELKKKRRGLFLCHENGILEQAMGEFRKVIGNTAVFAPFFGVDKDKDFNADKADMVFASFQSYADWKIVFPEDWFDFIIVDESHHGQAPTFKEVIQYFKPKKLLGITATPDRMDLKDIREIFGEEVVNYTLEEAIAKGWLTQVEYHILNDNLSHWKLKKIIKGILEEGQRVSVKQINESIFIKKRDEEIARTIQAYAGSSKKAIIFCEKIEHAENFQSHLPGSLTYHSKVKGGGKENRRRLNAFRGGSLQYILAVDKFNEGIDVPDAELIVFLRCTDSKTIFYQQLGRGLRKIFSKEKVIVLDFVANCQRVAVIEEMAHRIKEFAGNNFILNKDVLRVSGDNFDFIFNDKVLDILKVIQAIKKKLISEIPDLLLEYSPKNELPPERVIAGTNKKLWWKCSKENCGHEWQAAGNHRVFGTGCPACLGMIATSKNNLAATHPELAKEYMTPPKNLLPADKIIAGTNKKLWWKCSKEDCGHEWQAVGGSRAHNGNGCPACAGQAATSKNNLAATHPELVKEYMPPPKNLLPADKIIAGTGRKLWWKCSKENCGHEWQATGSHRVIERTGCPACANLTITSKNNLAATHPELAKEYMPPPKNLLPSDKVVAGTGRKLWWKCLKCDHEWQATGDERSRNNRGCPTCSDRRKKIGKK